MQRRRTFHWRNEWWSFVFRFLTWKSVLHSKRTILWTRIIFIGIYGWHLIYLYDVEYPFKRTMNEYWNFSESRIEALFLVKKKLDAKRNETKCNSLNKNTVNLAFCHFYCINNIAYCIYYSSHHSVWYATQDWGLVIQIEKFGNDSS